MLVFDQLGIHQHAIAIDKGEDYLKTDFPSGKNQRKTRDQKTNDNRAQRREIGNFPAHIRIVQPEKPSCEGRGKESQQQPAKNAGGNTIAHLRINQPPALVLGVELSEVFGAKQQENSEEYRHGHPYQERKFWNTSSFYSGFPVSAPENRPDFINIPHLGDCSPSQQSIDKRPVKRWPYAGLCAGLQVLAIKPSDFAPFTL